MVFMTPPFWGIEKNYLCRSGTGRRKWIFSENLKRLIEIGNMFALLS